MRKAYEEDLQEEKDKYKDALKTMYTDDFLEEIRHRHRYVPPTWVNLTKQPWKNCQLFDYNPKELMISTFLVYIHIKYMKN